MKNDEPDLTLHAAGELMEHADGVNNMAKFLYVAKCVMEAVMLAIGDEAEAKKNALPEATPPAVASSA